MTKAKTAKTKETQITISAPNLEMARFDLTGTAPLVLHRFGSRAKQSIRSAQEAGSTKKKGTKKEARDFEADFKDACYVSEEGWYGIPASAFRTAMIDACRLVGFKMTHAKLSIFIMEDGFERADQMPLVRITSGDPEMHIGTVRLANGVTSLAARPMWKKGWKCELLVRFDADQFTLEDVSNLLTRVGFQVGIGEGRANSRKSNGCGWGFFEIDPRGETENETAS